MTTVIMMYRMLFVCTGNICRSPSAEVVMRQLIMRAKQTHAYCVDSAGTSDFHHGQEMDQRAARTAQKRGYDTKDVRARPLCADDFFHNDIIWAMARDHLQFMQDMKATLPLTKPSAPLALFSHGLPQQYPLDVPDPYYGGQRGFENVLSMIEDGCRYHWQQIRQSDVFQS